MLVLGKGKTGQSIDRYLIKRRIKHDFLNTEELKRFDYKTVVKSPGIRGEIVKKLKENGSLVINDVELLYQMHKKKIIGVTGTNGKSTVTALIEHLTGFKACGNIGVPVLDTVDTFDSLVIELSSFMLDDINTFRPNIGIILNLGQAHQDSYDSTLEYHYSKLKITKNMKETDYLIYNYDDINLRTLVEKIKVKKIPISLNKRFNTYFKRNNFYYKKKKIAKYSKMNLIGDHNIYNIMFSIEVAMLLKIKPKAIKNRLYSFKGLPYRLEKIKNNVFNDSKSTNIESTVVALKCFKRVTLICGGYDRGEDYNRLIPYLKRIKICLCYGKSSNRIEEFMRGNNVTVLAFNSLKDLMTYLSQIKKRGIVLFSPFHASYDQYKSFIERGVEFNKMVNDFKII